MSKAGVKVMGQGQISGALRSILGARLCRVQQTAISVITSLRAYTDNSMDAIDQLLMISCR